MSNPYGYVVAPPQQQQQQQQHAVLLPPTNIDPALEGVVKSFMRSEKYGRKIKNLVRATSVPGRQNYKFAPATALTQQETRLWRNNLMQDEIVSNNPFWTARWMRVFGIAPRLDDSLLKVPWIKCERHRSADGDARSNAPLHRKETYLDLRDEQNRNWAMDSFTSGIDCAQKGQLDDAIKAYTQAIQIDAKCVEAYVARGCTFANIKKWRAAVMDFRAALNLDPSNISARQYLETTMAQEEEHRLNPSMDAHAVGVLANPSNTTAFGGDANLDDINEIVLDTDALHNSPAANHMQNRGRSPPPQNHVADDIKGGPKEKDVPVQGDYSPNVNYDYSPDIQYDRSPKLSHKNDPTEERLEPKASVKVEKDIPGPSVKTDSIDKSESHPMKSSDDIKDTNAVLDANGPSALPTLKGPSEDTKKVDRGEDKDQTSGVAGTATAERRRSRSRSKTRDRNNTTAGTRGRSFDREKMNSSRRGRSPRSPARNKADSA
ncbi:hypothetical protein KVV02_000185 [Mortierella alpina]|uniref:Uncharacterized protein n=1 Tax=Mortierella alpina TaxID=64518 RepID=A0A9P8IFB6_MORAP|nr:hypothetical protein KVV02_000185 [Mortierella alpina]